MRRTEAMLVELANSLDNIKNQLGASQSLYEAELHEVAESIQFARKSIHHASFFKKNDVIKSIMKIMNKISEDIASAAAEMACVANYSAYTQRRLQDVAVRQVVREELDNMLRKVVAVRPEIRNTELSSLVKTLRE